jgi:hypothetical protein
MPTRAMQVQLAVSWIWYALALAVPLAVTFAAIGLNTALSAPVPDIAEFSVWYACHWRLP